MNDFEINKLFSRIGMTQIVKMQQDLGNNKITREEGIANFTQIMMELKEAADYYANVQLKALNSLFNHGFPNCFIGSAELEGKESDFKFVESIK